MKNTKRVLLSLLAAVMLFGCFGVMASADGDYITYTVKGGDTALGICEGLKIDFFANQAWISEVNGIGSYNNIKVNQVLYLPTFDTSKDLARANRVKEEIKKASAAAKPAVVTSAAPAAVGTTTMGDSVVSYLVNYKLQPGETVADACAKLGVDFNANAEKIKKLSGITNYYHVPAGQIVVIPSSTVPQGSSYTQIVAHKVKAGETAAIICGQYKLDLAKVEGQLKALNNTENLSRISVPEPDQRRSDFLSAGCGRNGKRTERHGGHSCQARREQQQCGGGVQRNSRCDHGGGQHRQLSCELQAADG